MNKTVINGTTEAFEALFKEVMNLYWTYLETIEKYIKRIPETEVSALEELNIQTEEVLAALEYDTNVFQKAVDEDRENLQKVSEELQIHNIQKSLNI